MHMCQSQHFTHLIQALASFCLIVYCYTQSFHSKTYRFLTWFSQVNQRGICILQYLITMLFTSLSFSLIYMNTHIYEYISICFIYWFILGLCVCVTIIRLDSLWNSLTFLCYLILHLLLWVSNICVCVCLHLWACTHNMYSNFCVMCGSFFFFFNGFKFLIF